MFSARYLTFVILGLAFISFAAKNDQPPPSTEQIEELRQRVAALETYTQNLQAAINEFSKNLIQGVDQQLQTATSKVAVLSPTSKKVSKIETNTGQFLISVQRLDKIDKGYRLFLQIGNPNAATFGDVKLRVFWGEKWEPGTSTSYEKWRQTLKGSEFSYVGMLESGMWTDIAVDLKPADYAQVQHIECEMEVNTVKLLKKADQTP